MNNNMGAWGVFFLLLGINMRIIAAIKEQYPDFDFHLQ